MVVLQSVRQRLWLKAIGNRNNRRELELSFNSLEDRPCLGRRM